jgi:hypothetical protein
MSTSVDEPAAIQEQIHLINVQIIALGKEMTACIRELTRIQSARGWNAKGEQIKELRGRSTTCQHEIRILRERAESLNKRLTAR